MNPTISYHIGAHGNVSEHLSKVLHKNRAYLKEQDVIVPFPSKYRKIERQIYDKNLTLPISLEEQNLFFEKVTDTHHFQRFVVSHNAFLSNRLMAITANELYPSLQKKMHFLDNLYFDLDIEIYFEIESLATFPFTVYETIQNDKKKIFNSSKFMAFRWSEVVQRISRILPSAKIIIFCSEDLIFVWPDIVRRMTGLSSVFQLQGILDFPLSWLDPMKKKEFVSEMQLASSKTIEGYSFLIEKYCPPFTNYFDKNQFLGWTEEKLTVLNSLYQKDLDDIGEIPNVEIL